MLVRGHKDACDPPRSLEQRGGLRMLHAAMGRGGDQGVGEDFLAEVTPSGDPKDQ